MSASALFIHSLFRSGSTYMFQVFRRSDQGYWCYEEPLHELMLRISREGDYLLRDTDLKSRALRHPELDKPYLAEYMLISEKIGDVFAKRFPYDTFFLGPGDKDEGLMNYFGLLINAAQGRPVLQLCRSTGRIDWLKRNFGGIHLFVWRNPWNQWWSYQVDAYFNTVNFLILNAPSAPPVIRAIRVLVGAEDFHSENVSEEFVFFSERNPGPHASYRIFYALWLHAMLECPQKVDITINMEQLSNNRCYQDAVESRLQELGVNGIHFSDCNIYQSVFLKDDVSFFQEAEEDVHRIFLENGYSKADLAQVVKLRQESDALIPTRQDMVEDLARARGLLWREMADAAALRQAAVESSREIARLKLDEAELSRVYNSLSWRSTSYFRRIYRFMLNIYHAMRDAMASGKAE